MTKIFIFFIIFLITFISFVFADIIIGDFNDSNYFDWMINLGNINNLEEANSYQLEITETYDENFIPTSLFDDSYQLEGAREELIIETNPYNNLPTFNTYPLDYYVNENETPFGGFDNDPSLANVVIPE